MVRARTGLGMAVLAAAMLAGTSACSGGSSSAATPTSTTAGTSATSAKPSATAKPTPSKPAGPPMLLDTIVPVDGSTVGVAMPISVVFSNPVAASSRADVEKHLKLTTSTPVTGAWHWFGDRRVDFRPQSYWASGTHVTIDAQMTGVPNGNGRYGVHDYRHSFTIGPDDRTTVDVKAHTMRVTRNGSVVKTMPINAGSPTWPSWDGTMAVIDKSSKVHMTSCSVGISCDKSSPNFYDLTLPWDVHLTTSGTYIHYSTGDPYPGHGNGSHGCVHLSLVNAKWFYNFTRQGDPVTITGSPRGKAAPDNGYADYNLSWSQWLAGSGEGQITT